MIRRLSLLSLHSMNASMSSLHFHCVSRFHFVFLRKGTRSLYRLMQLASSMFLLSKLPSARELKYFELYRCTDVQSQLSRNYIILNIYYQKRLFGIRTHISYLQIIEGNRKRINRMRNLISNQMQKFIILSIMN